MSDISEDIEMLSPEQRELLELLLREENLSVAQLPIAPRRQDTNPLPLSFAQQRLWFLNQLDPYSVAYNVAVAIRLNGPLKVTALEQSFNEIVQRHEALRTTFKVVDGQPVQIIASHLTISLPVRNLNGLSRHEQGDKVQRLAIEEFQQPFDLVLGPVARISLLRLTETEHVLLLTVHHIVSDAWSMDILLGELATLYNAYASGKPSPLPTLPIQYADFAIWQREQLQGTELETQLAYWKQQLSDAPALLDLPTDRPRPVIQTHRGASYTFEFQKRLLDELKTLSSQEESTLFMTLLAAFQVLLYRYTGQDDIVVGSPIANRTRIEVENLIGFFVNTLALRAKILGSMNFRDVLKQVREVTLEAYAHQDLPFQQVVEALQPKRILSHTPIFQVMFGLQNAPATSALEFVGLTISPVDVEHGVAKFDLALMMIGTEEDLVGIVEYNTDLFDVTTIRRMLEHFQTLLGSIITWPEQRISTLPLLTEAEHHRMIVEWNDTQEQYSSDACIHELFEAQVRRTPEVVAVVSEATQVTYQELNQRANQLARHLRRHMVGPDVLVGLCVERTVEMLVGIFGILKAGGAYVPLDPMYPKERLAFMLQDTQVSLLLTQQRLVERLPEHAAQVICLDTNWKTIAAQDRANPLRITSPDHLAYVIYTSGSTGKPKGALLQHRGLCNSIEVHARILGMQPTSRMLQFASLSFDGSVFEVFTTLLAGATLCMGTPDAVLPGSDVLRRLRSQAITVQALPPSVLTLLSPEDLPDLHTILSVAEQALIEVIARWAEGHQVFNGYGPTEVTIGATITTCDNSGRRPHIGRPFANAEVYILDTHLQPVPIGVTGEIYISGVGLARGYLNRPELTAERFVPHPFGKKPGARLYKTGDMARYLPDGNLEFLGRVDHQIKFRGFRIELEEIATVLKQHQAVQEAVVLVREDTLGNKRLMAYIVPRSQQLPTSSDLRSHLKAQLPEYMLPSAYVVLEKLPLTRNRKVDHAALLAINDVEPEYLETFVAPSDTLQLQLVQLWEDILHIHPIGITNNFFDLGGHSLLAIRLMDRLQKQFGQHLPLSMLFQGGTIEHLANVLRQHDVAQPQSPLVAIQPHGSKRPFFCMHPIGGGVLGYYHLARHLGLDQPFYGLQDPSIHEETIPYISLETMAANYIAALRVVQPEGPYQLGGWSFGGIVAFEMAQQLQRQGHKIALLAIIDGASPASSNQLLDTEDARILAVITLELTRGSLGRNLHELYHDLRQIEPREQVDYVLTQMKQARLDLPSTGPLWVHQQLQIFKMRTQAIQAYVAQVYRGQITLFRSSERDSLEHSVDDTDRSMDLGWGKFSHMPLKIHVIPGYHDTMIVEPHVQSLAAELQLCLDKGKIKDVKEV